MVERKPESQLIKNLQDMKNGRGKAKDFCSFF